MGKIILTEADIYSMVESAIKKIVNEARRIQRLSDDNFSHQRDIEPEVLSQIKSQDKEYNQLFNLKGSAKTDRIAPFRGIPDSRQRKKIDNYQKELTNNIQQRLINNGEETFISKDNLNAPENVLKKLSDNGLEIEVKGKVFGYGNQKLPPTTMIINLTSAFNCPATNCPLHGKKCYAGKDEKLYTNTNLRNLRNEVTLDKLTIKELLKLLDMYIMSAPLRIRDIRLSESGDFKSQEVVDFCEKLAQHMEAKYGIRTTCYTHQRFDFSNCKSMVVNSSMPKNIIKGADRNYLVVMKNRREAFDKLPEGLHIDEQKGIATFKCHCDCYKCRFCYNRKEENGEHPDIRTDVYVLEH